MPAPVGAVVTIEPYDLVHNPDWPDPTVGDWLVTYSERTQQWGTAHQIVSARQIRSTVSPRRFALRAHVVGPAVDANIQEGDQIFPLVWYPRKRRRRRRAA